MIVNPLREAELDIRSAGDDVLVHDIRHAKVHVLNATAGYVLRLCDGEHSVDDIVGSLHAASGADRAIVAHDVETVLASFAALRLLVT